MKSLCKRILLIALALTLLCTLSGCTLTLSRLLQNAAGSAASDIAQPAPTAENADTVTISKAEYERLSRYKELDEVLKLVETYYYQEPDMNQLVEYAERGLLAGLGDPYTYYYNPQEYSDMWSQDTGEYAGIGIQISASYETKLCTVSRVFASSPALNAGLHKGDVLLRVDDVDVTAYTLNDAVAIMRGEVGSPVHVKVQRGDQLLEFDIPRAKVHVNWVSSCMLDEQIGLISLFEFSGDCFTAFESQLNALLSQGAKGLIIDLRDNPGGWVDDAVKIADLFLPKCLVAYYEMRDGTRQDYYAADGALDLPLVILINENSASSSEIFTGAMKDYGVATVVGKTSFGKGVVQFVLGVGTAGAGIQLTAAQYYTPKGNAVHKVGIAPDIEIGMPEGDTTLYELGDLNDAQLAKAYEVIRQKTSTKAQK
ncbi:MAG: S41 family peptidase [Eubacteriales bacterium]|nr:S41 family peptidase [Eubacteriales bacterium]